MSKSLFNQSDFFLNDDGLSFLENIPTLPQPSPIPQFPQQSVLSQLSITTSDTVMSENNLLLSFSQFCGLIEKHRSLQEAEIITTEGYAQQIGGILHRFLVLELRRSGKKTIWLRLDRRAGRSALRLLLTLGSAPAHDVVSLSSIFLRADSCHFRNVIFPS